MRSLLGVLAVVALAFTSGAGTNASASADIRLDDLSVARQALRDGFWEIVRTHASRVASDEARLILLEALAGEGNWREISARLDDWKDARGDGFDYYRAIAKGDHAAAMAILAKVGSPEGRAEASLFEARELAKAGKRDEAERIWRGLAAATNVGVRVRALASVNLMDASLLRRVYGEVDTVALRRRVGLRLGVSLLRDPKTEKEGEALVRSLVKDSPDTEGAREALLAVADAAVVGKRWKAAYDTYHEAIETWPDAARLSAVQESRGWVLSRLGRKEEALEAFHRAGELTDDAETKAKAMVKEGDLLQELGREQESMAVYRVVLEKYGGTAVAKDLKKVVSVRELESRGRELYRSFKYAEAIDVFAEVAKADVTRKPMMDYFSVLCLYGQGRDDEACAQARRLVAACPSESVRLDATLWLAKLLYNRREWKESGRLFVSCAERLANHDHAAEALLWAVRAAFAENDHTAAIQLSTQLVERFPATRARSPALLVQGEALLELARFDEAVLVFDRVAATEGTTTEERIRSSMLKADALYAMGADNSQRYVAALDAYRAVLFGGELSLSEQIVVSFKIARTLEKLKRTKDAFDTYYSRVVLAYREGRLANRHMTDEARAAFSRAAFRLADEFESRGKDRQTVNVLKLVIGSDVPASEEAAKRLEKILNRGRGL